MLSKESYYSSEIFDDESEKLSKNSWWFICHLNELENNFDFVTSNIFNSNVIVQNHNNGIIGFENICAHRFYRIKNEKKGNGELKCSTHGWLYSKEGRAVGIPSKNEIFDFDDLEKSDLYLRKIDIGFCGKFLFAKLKSQFDTSLKDYLGDFYIVLENISEIIAKPSFEKNYNGDCNWKLLYELSLDEYHVVDVHPDTFGALWGHFKMNDKNHEYRYSESHSSFFYNKNNLNYFLNSFLDKENIFQKCTDDDYKIFHIFPNLTITPFQNGVSVILIDPISAVRSIMRVINYKYNIKNNKSKKKLECFYDTLAEQDILASENQQSVLKQRWKDDILSSKEIRINNFREIYKSTLNKSLGI